HGYDAVAGKQVHHKNEIPWDNRPENLEPLSDEEHILEHHDELIAANPYEGHVVNSGLCSQLRDEYTGERSFREIGEEHDIPER
ncbi:hypothetical protein GY652_27320, partial [Escherichia coli]|uniref:HNH endonuclease n=1 Tax=Escherichia coli TaxID=562 RepID=UPI0015C17FD1